MNYNFIGHLETFDDDLSTLMNKLNPQVSTAQINFDNVNRHTAAKNRAITGDESLKSKTTVDWFANVPCRTSSFRNIGRTKFKL